MHASLLGAADSDRHKLGIMCQQLRDSSYVPDGVDGVDYSDNSSNTPGLIFCAVVALCKSELATHTQAGRSSCW
jgi:hypothetical protein